MIGQAHDGHHPRGLERMESTINNVHQAVVSMASQPVADNEGSTSAHPSSHEQRRRHKRIGDRGGAPVRRMSNYSDSVYSVPSSRGDLSSALSWQRTPELTESGWSRNQ